MKEPNLPPHDGGNGSAQDENGAEPQSSIENMALTESSFSEHLESFFKKMKTIAIQNEAQLIHYHQLKENYHELETQLIHYHQLKENHQELQDEFQKLKFKYQKLEADYKHLMNSHQKIEHESKKHLQQLEDRKKAEQFYYGVKKLLKDYEKIDGDNGALDPKYFSLMGYFKFRGFRFRLSAKQTDKTHSLLQKKSKETGFEMRKNMVHGFEEITYHSYVLRIILCF
jgi:DNA repair exonuclease SbcCD ATPase subunit